MKKALNISCVQACDLNELPPNTILICINNPYDTTTPRVTKFAPTLSLEFPDITYPFTDKDGNEYKVITDKQAREIVECIYDNQEKSLISHCTMGISRSGAVCLFANIIFGHKLKKYFWETTEPNAYVLGVLMKEWCKFQLELNH